MSTIEFKQIGRVFERDGKPVPIIEGFDLTVRDREFVAVVGPSGCGKTTCMRMAAGLEFPTAGQLLVSGKPVTRPGPERAVVFQQFALFPWKSVYDNIDFGLRAQKLPPEQRRETITRYIALMNLKGYESAYPHQLSGGMQQRVAIARAYALDPDVLLMDEPFGALDAQTRVVMQEELVKLARKHPRTVLFITHAVEEAVYLADRVVIMAARPGRVKEVLDIRSVREAEGWDRHSRIEDVMDLASFVHLRTRIWKSLREEHAGTDH
jgi:NitT/TauT family transport system ATP-binding protein